MMNELMNRVFGKSNNIQQFLAEGAVIVDVRTPLEFSYGHIKGSKNIPLDSLKNRIDEVRQLQKPVIVVCQTGNRSSLAKSFLEREGLAVLNGGSWSGLNKIL